MYKNFGIIAMYLLTVTHISQSSFSVEFVPNYKKIMVKTDEDSKALYTIDCDEAGTLDNLTGDIKEETYTGSTDFSEMAQEISGVYINYTYDNEMPEPEFLEDKLKIHCDTEGDESEMKVRYIVDTNDRRMLI